MLNIEKKIQTKCFLRCSDHWSSKHSEMDKIQQPAVRLLPRKLPGRYVGVPDIST